jgi:uncharacterized protein YndB with AHSA1/START domain
MKDKLQFEFKVDKENRTITVIRAYDAELPRVWSAWTERDQLDEWWAPKPYQARTKSMTFREGGFWLYAMVGPDEEMQWCRADFMLIETLKRFSWRDAFCDESGSLVQEFPRSVWTNSFSREGDKTIVTNLIQFETTAHLDKYLEMGFREGYTQGLNNLEAYLKGN